MPRVYTYTCAICGVRFGDANAGSAARERDRHQQLDHGFVAPSLGERYEQRLAVLADQGYRVGGLVRVLRDGHPDLPAHARFLRSVGEVCLNMSHDADRISVKFSTSASPHAIPVGDLEVA